MEFQVYMDLVYELPNDSSIFVCYGSTLVFYPCKQPELQTTAI